MKPRIELYNLDVAKFIGLMEKCQSDVFLVTDDGDKLNLKSKLSQFMGLAKLVEGGIIAKASIVCDDVNDFGMLFKYCVEGVA